MGIEAAKKAIKNASINPEEIDIIIWVGTQHKDYLMWLASVNIAEKISAKNALTFDMSALCGSVVVGIEIAKSLLCANKKYNTALLVSGSRDIDFVNLHNKDTFFMLDIGAGGSAMIIRKNWSKNIILESAFKCDGSFANECLLKYGGSKNWPIKPKELDKLYFTIHNAKKFKDKLKKASIKNFNYVINQAMENSCLCKQDIDYIAMLHIHKSSHENLLKGLGLNDKNTTYLDHYGHLGQNDQILSIELGLQNTKIRDNSNVVLVAAGIGFIWAAVVIRWG